MIKYKKIEESKRYKYILQADYECQTGIKLPKAVFNPYISMHVDGKIIIKTGYAWDGPSGPAPDIKSLMRASLVHDALYQLMRESLIDYKTTRKNADRLLRDMSKEDGLIFPFPHLVYFAVRVFSRKYAKPVLTDI